MHVMHWNCKVGKEAEMLVYTPGGSENLANTIFGFARVVRLYHPFFLYLLSRPWHG